MKYAFQSFTHAYGPGHRRATNFQYFFYLIHQIDGVAAFAVEFINKGNDRCIPQSTYIHQFDSAFLDSLGAVDHH